MPRSSMVWLLGVIVSRSISLVSAMMSATLSNVDVTDASPQWKFGIRQGCPSRTFLGGRKRSVARKKPAGLKWMARWRPPTSVEHDPPQNAQSLAIGFERR